MAERILLSDLFRNAGLILTNRLRLLRRRGTAYVILSVSGTLPERTTRPRRPFPLSLLPWPAPPASIESISRALERLALDPRIQGVVLMVSGLEAAPATIGNLREAIGRFRAAGKRAVAYLPDASFWSYYLACACDEILVPESAAFRATGLWSEAIFLKDTLALAGLEADFEAIAEYKVSPDMLRRSEMTGPHREMLESLLDSLYAQTVNAMAQGRGLEPDKVIELMDSAPMTAQEALDVGLLDAICYEDEIPSHLGLSGALRTWDEVGRRLLRPRRWHSRRSIGVISLEGAIVLGSSRQPPFPIPLPLPLPSVQAGSDTLIQQLRSTVRRKDLAAVVLHVDSPGGSALASDLIWREVASLRKTKPVVVHMGNLAASGGYYVSAPANAIVCQPTTLTGSIGIWGGKIVTRRLFQKIHASRETISRGKAAGLYSDSAPFSDAERAKVRADIGEGYSRFKARVAAGRDMTDDEVEAIARGRVWTGEQALDLGLVDQLGDLQTAASLARELAGVDPGRYARLINIPIPKRYQGPASVPADAGEWLANLSGLLREGVFALAPWLIRIQG